MRFLVVDDSRTVRLGLREAIAQAAPPGAQVAEAATATEALDAFLAADVDVVFLDLMLPDGKGADVLRAMLEARSRSRVAVVSGLSGESAEAVDVLSMGAFAYLRKPVRTSDVKRVLDEVAAEEGRGGRIR